jgi:putative flippase GtrA
VETGGTGYGYGPMSDLAMALWDWLHTREGRKLFRYTMTSVITTGVSLFVLGIVFGVLRLWTEVPSTVFANVVAAFPSYWLNRRWAWGKHGRSHLVKEVLPFWIMSAASISFSIVGASVARYLGHRWHLDHLEQTLLVLTANVVSFGIFWILKLMVFNRTFKVPTLMEEMDEHLRAEEDDTRDDDVERAGVR